MTPDRQKALDIARRLFTEALPKFNWGASCLDANAIDLLNRAPEIILQALESSDAIQRDAARYRYLRDRAALSSFAGVPVAMVAQYANGRHTGKFEMVVGDELDKIVDRFMTSGHR